MQKIALMAGSTIFALALVLGLGSFVKYGDGTFTKAIVLKSWQAKNNIFGEAEIGIFEMDTLFGWKLKPNAVGRHFQPYGFRVKYHIDEEGHRVTPGSYDLPKVLFIGGSFSFGHGVKDDENFIWRLGENFPSYKMINGCTMAWGTAQSWLQLQKELQSTDDVQMVVYGFITHHLHRNYVRKEWLDLVKSWGRQNPHFEIENGQLVNKGLADPEKDALPLDEDLKKKERQITLRFLQEMKAFCDAHSIPFLTVYLPDGEESDFDEEISSVLSPAELLDMRKTLPYNNIRLKGDSHPSPEGHREIAGQLAPVLGNILENKSALTADTAHLDLAQ